MQWEEMAAVGVDTTQGHWSEIWHYTRSGLSEGSQSPDPRAIAGGYFRGIWPGI